MPSTEKITLYMPAMDLAHVDMLVEPGLFASRSDLIRASVRAFVDSNRELLEETMVRHQVARGNIQFENTVFERFKARGEKMKINVAGTFTLTDDVDPELAAETIESIEVYGIFKAPKVLKKRLADRTTIGGAPLSQRLPKGVNWRPSRGPIPAPCEWAL